MEPEDKFLNQTLEASEKEHKKKERERRQRGEELNAQEAAWEATAIAESTRLMGTLTESQRLEAAADAEFERILRESAAEAKQKKTAEEQELARLHANFGTGVRPEQAGRSHRQSPTSSNRQRANSNTTPQTTISATSKQQQKIQTAVQNQTPRNPRPPIALPVASPVAPSEEARSRGGNFLSRALNSVRRPRERSSSNPNQQQARRDAPARLEEIRPEDIRESNQAPPPRHRPNSASTFTPTPMPAPTPSPPRQTPQRHDRRNSNQEHHGTNTPLQALVRRRSPPVPDRMAQGYPSPRRVNNRARGHEELDAQMRQALNSSHRNARIDERYRDPHSRREEEMIRRAMEESLGDAPPPPDPSEGLLDPPPGYKDIHGDKILDPRRYTTTNEKGNEPGYRRKITPEILKIMEQWLAELQKFDAESQAAGKDQPIANNALAKKKPNAKIIDSGSRNSGSDDVDDLRTLLGGSRPAPSQPVQPQAVAANEFVSRMPGLATDARTRIPTARPWDNVFSRLPTARPAARAGAGERRSGL